MLAAVASFASPLSLGYLPVLEEALVGIPLLVIAGRAGFAR